ncbi:MAG: cupredoxin domain-containing protein, partial [Candidatus Nitrosotenuis sp.]
MTAADKFGIAFSIGFTVALIAIALSFGTMDNTIQAPVTPAPAPPIEEPVMEETPEEVVEEEMVVEEEENVEEMEEEIGETAPMSADVSIPKGSSTPGCEADDACYVPAEITVGTGGTVTWTNDDTAAHTVTSGTPIDGPDGIFDSSIVMSGNTFEYTFEEAGEYDYFCIVHPWMTG